MWRVLHPLTSEALMVSLLYSDMTGPLCVALFLRARRLPNKLLFSMLWFSHAQCMPLCWREAGYARCSVQTVTANSEPQTILVISSFWGGGGGSGG